MMGRTARSAAGVAFLLLALAPAAFATDTVCDGTVRDAGDYVCTREPIDTTWIPDISDDGVQITDSAWRPIGSNGLNSYRYVSGLSGGTFLFYGNTYSAVSIGSNGYVMFGGNSGASVEEGSGFIPSLDLPNNAIYAYGDALLADSADGGAVYYLNVPGTTCDVDRNGDGQPDLCMIVQWESLPNQLDPAAFASVSLALDLDTDEAIIEVYGEEEGFAGLNLPNLVGTENLAGTAGLWFKDPEDDVNSRAAGAGQRFIFRYDPPDTTPPADVAKQTNTSTDLESTVEYIPPGTDFAGTLVLRSIGTPVVDAPVNGTTYSVGELIGSSEVRCIADEEEQACVDTMVFPGQDYYYRTFAFDWVQNYSGGSPIAAFPRSSSIARWAINVNVASLGPPTPLGDAAATTAVLEVGNDRLLHRFSAAGLRDGWDSPVVGGTVQGRPAVGDIGPEGGPVDNRAYVAAQSGILHRYRVDSPATPDTRDVIADAGCAVGGLQAGPVVSLDKYDDNSNPNDDRVVQATRCTGSALAENKVLLYSLDLGTLHASWPNTPAHTLGPVNGSPVIVYGDTDSNSIVIVTARAGGSVTLAALEIAGGGVFPEVPWGTMTEAEVGAFDTGPVLVKRGGEQFVVVGNTRGELRVINVPAGSGGTGGALPVAGTYLPGADFDGAVKGMGSTNVIAGTNWIVWTTDTQVHGIQLTPSGFSAPTYWERDIPSPSPPLVLGGFLTGARYRAFVGGADGRLYVHDATTGGLLMNPTLLGGTTLGEPAFDYNDGVNQGLVVGTSTGVLFWVPLPN